MSSTPSARPLTDFESVYETHASFVWRALRRLGVPEQDLADTLQEVFVVVYRRWADFEGRAQVTTWLYRIAFRIARDRRRRAHVRREILEPSALEADRASTDMPDDCLQRRQDLALLDYALDCLSLEQRAVFTLFELEELSGEQIAAMLGVPVPTVYSRLRLARVVFQRALRRQAQRSTPPVSRGPEVSGCAAAGQREVAGHE